MFVGSTFYRAQHDTLEPIEEQLLDATYTPIANLTDALSIHFVLQDLDHTGAIVIDSPATVSSNTDGIVAFDWTTVASYIATEKLGRYRRWWKVTWGGTRTLHVPNGSTPYYVVVTSIGLP